MYYTTFIKSKHQNNEIDYLQMFLTNKEITTKIVNNIEFITAETKTIPKTTQHFFEKINAKSTINYLNTLITEFFKNTDFLNNKEKYYREFYIPKRKGGYRHLIEPQEELKHIQRVVLDTLYNIFSILPHRCAHAFSKNRDAYTNAEVHVGSTYIIKYDFKDFFPSIDKELLKEKLHSISFLHLAGDEFINNICELATYKNSIPQGSPLSPYLSNIIMTEFDYTIIKLMTENKLPHYKYSRYADDLTFSASAPGKINELTSKIKEILKNQYQNKIKLNTEKTKVLKNTGKCFITGIKLNKDNQLTYGHEKKKQLKHEICNMLIKYQNNSLCKEEAQSILGKIAFMKRIEPEYTDYICKLYLKKFNAHTDSLSNYLKDILK